MTEEEVNRSGAAPDLRYFHTTYGTNFGYNERARKYHRSYGLVTPPTNPAYAPHRLGDLDTAPLFRRDHLGFRQEYPDTPFTWSESAAKLTKNQKTYGGDDEADAAAGQAPATSSFSAHHPIGALPPRRVAFRATERDVPLIPERAAPVTKAAAFRRQQQQQQSESQSQSQAQTQRQWSEAADAESELDYQQHIWERQQAEARDRASGQRWNDDTTTQGGQQQQQQQQQPF